MSKRDQIPPYEIMRSRSATPGSESAQALEPQPAVVPDPARSTPVSAGRAPWWVGSSAPLVIRVPRGLALLSVLGLLLLIVVAYGVGAARGAAGAKPAEPVSVGIGDRPAPGGYFVAQEEDPAEDGDGVEVPEKPEVGDLRDPGLNYMRLVQSTEADCRELASFFGARGVAIQLVPVHNSQFFIAYAVKRGYRGDELGSESCKRYEQQLRSIGRQWKASHGGRGTDLSTMYFERYDG